MAGGNVIELVARWNDQGVQQGLAQAEAKTKDLARGIGDLTNVFGVALGIGAITNVRVLVHELGNLIRAPFEAAKHFSELADTIKSGGEAMDEHTSKVKEAREEYEDLFRTVGDKGINQLRKLNETNKQSAGIWKEVGMEISTAVAPLMELLAYGIMAQTAPLTVGGRGKYSQTFTPIFGPQTDPSKSPEALWMEEVDARRRAIEAVNHEAKLRREAADRLAKLQNEEFNKRYTSQMKEFGGPQTGEQWWGSMQGQEPISGMFGTGLQYQAPGLGGASMLTTGGISQLGQVAVSAAQAAGQAFVSIAAGVGTTIRSIGDALRSFIQSVIGSLLSSLAKLGLQFLGGLLPGAGILGTIGKLFMGGSGAVIRATPTTIQIFNGLNMRTLYNEATKGSLAATNDLVLMRAEIG